MRGDELDVHLRAATIVRAREAIDRGEVVWAREVARRTYLDCPGWPERYRLRAARWALGQLEEAGVCRSDLVRHPTLGVLVRFYDGRA